MPDRVHPLVQRKTAACWLVILAVCLLFAPAAFAEDEEAEPEDQQQETTEPEAAPDAEEPAADLDLDDLSSLPVKPEQDDAEEEKAEPEKKKSMIDRYLESEPAFGTYGKWLRHYEKMAMEANIWGGSATVPEGVLVATFGWGTGRPYKRFDENRKETDILPIIEFDDPWGGSGKFLEFDFKIGGKASGYLIAVLYGVTKNFSIGFTTTFVQTEIKFEPIFTPGTVDKLGIASIEDFYRMLELLGRPRPKLRYKTNGADWGDTQLMTMYNYYRNDWFSTGVNLSLNMPTAHTADPNENLTFGLGPDIDTGPGAWGIQGSLPFDFKPPDPVGFISFSVSLEGGYYLEAKRRSPRFLEINQEVRDYIEAQGVDVDMFQNLTDMDDYYIYQPGPWLGASIGIGLGPVGLSYRHGWGFTGRYQSNSSGFKQMIDVIGLVGNGDDGKITASLSIPLTPLYIPALAQLRMDYMTDGRNNLVFRDVYQVGLGIFIPLAVPEHLKFKGGKK